MIFPPCTQPPASAQSTTPTSMRYIIQGEDEPCQSAVPRFIQRNFQTASSELSNTLIDIHNLKGREENWNRYGAPTPNPVSIDRAKRWIKQAHANTSSSRKPWITPHVGSDECGDVSFEWWRGERKITLYITPDAVEYLKVWGIRMFSEMEDGTINSAGQWSALWNWLHKD